MHLTRDKRVPLQASTTRPLSLPRLIPHVTKELQSIGVQSHIPSILPSNCRITNLQHSNQKRIRRKKNNSFHKPGTNRRTILLSLTRSTSSPDDMAV